MLRHPTDDFRAGPQQFLVTLLRRVPNARQEELLVTVEAVDQFFLVSPSEPGTLFDEPVKIIPAHGQELGRLDALQREQTGLAPVHAVERGHEVPFEEELESDVLPVPSSSSRVLAGTTSGVIRSFSRIIEMVHLTNRHEDSNFNLLYVHQPLEEFTGTRNIERNTDIA